MKNNKLVFLVLVFLVFLPVVHAVNISVTNINGFKYSSVGTNYVSSFKDNSNWGDGVKFCISTIGGNRCFIYQPTDISYSDLFGSQDYISNINSVTGNVSGNTIVYPGVFNNTDLKYTVRVSGMKEEFIIHSPFREPASYLNESVTLNFGGYIKYDSNLEIWADGVNRTNQNFLTHNAIEFRYKNVTVYSLPKPYIKFNGSDRNIQAEYEVKNQSGQIYFYTKVSYEDLLSAQYPIIVDPSVAPGTYLSYTSKLLSGFEVAITDNFTAEGTSGWARATDQKNSGSASAKLVASSAAQKNLTSNSVNMSTCSIVRIRFYSYNDDMDDSGDGRVYLKNSSGSWVLYYDVGADANDDAFVLYEFNISTGYYNHSTFQMKYNTLALASTENWWIDDVNISCGEYYTVQPITVVLNTSNNTVFSVYTPTLNFTGTDPDSYNLTYNVQVDNSSNFDTFTTRSVISFDPGIEGSNLPLSSTGNDAAGEIFNSSTGGNILSATFRVNKSGSPTGDVQVFLYAADTSSGRVFGTNVTPTGSALASSNIIDASAIPSGSQALLTFNFTGAEQYNMLPNTLYAIGLWFSGGDSTNIVKVYINLSEPYEGNRFIWSGTSYVGSSTDATFYVNFSTGASLIDSFSNASSGTYNFTNTVTGGDTNPFTSGNMIGYNVLSSNSSFYFNGSVSDPNSVWSDDAYLTDDTIDSYMMASTSTAGSSSSNYLQTEGTTVNSSYVGRISAVRARIHYGPIWGSYTTLSTPVGGWTWSKVSGLETRVYWATSNVYADIYVDGDAGGTSLGTASASGLGSGSIDRLGILVEYTPVDVGQYYWKTRAIDPEGSLTWSSWSDTRTFNITVSTGATLSCSYGSGISNIQYRLNTAGSFPQVINATGQTSTIPVLNCSNTGGASGSLKMSRNDSYTGVYDVCGLTSSPSTNLTTSSSTLGTLNAGSNTGIWCMRNYTSLPVAKKSISYSVILE